MSTDCVEEVSEGSLGEEQAAAAADVVSQPNQKVRQVDPILVFG